MAKGLTEFLVKYVGDSKDYHATDKRVNDSLAKTDKRTQKTGGSFKKSMGKMGRSAGIMAGSLVAAGAAAYAFTDKMSQQLDMVDKGSQKMGVSAESYQEWSHVLNLAGTNINVMEKGIKTMSTAAYEASIGTKTYADTFLELGMSATDTNGKLKTSEELMAESIKALSGMEDITKRNALATKLYGRAGQELIPVLNMGEAAINKEIEALHKNNAVMSGESVKAGANFQDMLTRTQATLQGVAMDLGSKLMPAVTQLIDEVLPPLMDLLASITPLLEPIIDLASSLIQMIMPFITSLLDMLKPILPMIVGIVTQLLEGLLPPLLEILKKLLPPILKIIEMMLPYVKRMLDALMPIFGDLVDALLPLMIESLEAMMPILEPILALITKLFEYLVPMIKWMLDNGLKPMLENMTKIYKWLGEAIPDIIKWFTGLWDGIKKFFADVELLFIQMGLWFDRLGEKTGEVVGSINQYFADMFAKVSEVFASIGTKIAEVWTSISTFVSSITSDVSGSIAKFAISIAESVLAIVKDMINGFKNVLKYIIEWDKELIAKVKAVWDKVVSGIAGFKDKLLDKIAGVVDSIKKAFTDKFKDFVNIGKNILDGIIKGMVQGANGLWDSIKKVGGWAVKLFKKIFDIASPSKLMERAIGKPIMDGIILGMEKQKKALEKTVSGVARVVTDGFAPIANAVDSMVDAFQGIPELGVGGTNKRNVTNVIVSGTEADTVFNKQKNDLHVYAHVSEEYEEDLQKLTKAMDRSDFEDSQTEQGSQLMSLISAISRRLQLMQKMITRTITNAVEKIGEYVESLVDSIVKNVKILLSSGKGINDKLTSIISQIKTFIITFIARISALSKALLKALETLGTDIIKAVLDGAERIVEAMDKAMDKLLKTLVSAITNAIAQGIAKVLYFLQKIYEELKHHSTVLGRIAASLQSSSGKAPNEITPPFFNPGTGGDNWTVPAPIGGGDYSAPTTINNSNKYIQNEYNIVKKDNLFNQPGDLALMGYK